MSGVIAVDNKDALVKFYEQKDPSRVKNVEPMFLRWEEDTILDAIQAKYGEIPSGWMSRTHGPSFDDHVKKSRAESSDSEDGSAVVSPLPANGKLGPPPPPSSATKPRISNLQVSTVEEVVRAVPPPSPVNKKAEKAEEERKKKLALEEEKQRKKDEEEAKKKKIEEEKQRKKEEEEAKKKEGRKTGFSLFGSSNRKSKTESKTDSKAEKLGTITEKSTPPPPPPAAAAPEPPKPMAAAPALNIGSGPPESGGYKRPPRDSPELEKYHKMSKSGLPQGAVENAMIRDGYHPAAVFDDPLNNPDAAPKKPAAPLVIPKPKPPPPPREEEAEEAESEAPPSSVKTNPQPMPNLKKPEGMSLMDEIKWKADQKRLMEANAGGKAGSHASIPAPPKSAPPSAAVSKPPPPPPKPKPGDKESAPPAAVSSSLKDRQNMLAGILGGGGGPKPAADKPKVAPAKKWGTIDTSGEGASSASGGVAKVALPTASASSGNDGPPPDLTKYEKMAKMLPQGAVENAMTRDGIDPGWMFGENCQTVKSDKRPVKAGGGGASSPPTQQQQPAFSPMAQSNHPPAMPQINALPQQQFSPPPQQQHLQPQQQPPYHHQQFIAPGPFQPQGFPSPPPPVYQPMQSQWVQVWSAEHNHIYYTNPLTGESSWSPPANFQATPPPPAMLMQQQRHIVTMMYNFLPTGANPQEIPVYQGDQVEVFNVAPDGWMTGRCLRTGQMGLVPANYAR